MKFNRLARCAGGILLAVVMLAGAGSATAQTGPVISAEPATTLYGQTNNPGGFVDSSDWGSYLSTQDSQAADDFVVPGNVFWKISSATAFGQIIGSSGGGVLSALVQIYSDGGASKPATLVYSQSFTSGPNATLAANFVVTPTSAITLGPGNYWFSVQARENCMFSDGSNCKHWVWTEWTGQSNGESVWQNPPGGADAQCTVWKPRVSVCHQPSGSTSLGLLFKLDGTATPIAAHVMLPIALR